MIPRAVSGGDIVGYGYKLVGIRPFVVERLAAGRSDALDRHGAVAIIDTGDVTQAGCLEDADARLCCSWGSCLRQACISIPTGWCRIVHPLLQSAGGRVCHARRTFIGHVERRVVGEPDTEWVIDDGHGAAWGVALSNFRSRLCW